MKNKLLFTAILFVIATNTFSQVPNYVPTNGLVGYWPFNGNAIDESVNANDGTVNGATLTSDRNGAVDNAYSFDGNNDYVHINNNFFDNGWPNFTLSCWYFLDQISNPNNANSSHILFNTAPHNGLACGLNCFGSNKYSLWLGNGSPATSWNVLFNNESIQNIQTNSWHNFVLVKYTNQYNLYIDGVLDISWIAATTISSYPYQMYFGSTDPSVSNEVIIGKLDDIGIWNRSLSDCEIQDLYTSQLGSANTSSTITQTVLDSLTLNGQTYTQSGTYTQVIPNAAGCDSTITLNLTLNFTGITELKDGIRIYPNPTFDNLTIERTSSLNSEYILVDSQGRLVLQGELTETITHLSLGKLEYGNYILQLENQSVPIRIVKQ